jgi:hypothetical protein
MKKALVLVGVIVVFSVLGALLDTWLGITFPSSRVAFAHYVFWMLYGSAIYAAISAKI